MAQPTPSPDAAQTRPDHHGPAVAHPADRPPRRWRRRLARLCAVLLLLVVVLVAAGPKLLSTAVGSRLLLAQVNKRVDGTVQVRDLSLAWFSGQRADGVVYTSVDGLNRVTAGSVDLPDVTLWALLTGDNDLGTVKVRDLHSVTTQPPPGGTPPVQGPPRDDKPTSGGPSPPAPPADPPRWMRGLSMELEVDGLSWRYLSQGIEPVDVVSPELTLSVPGNGEVRLQVAGAVTQGDESGRLDLDAQATGMIDLYGRVQPGSASYNITGGATQLPVRALSRLLSAQDFENPALAYLFGAPDRFALLLGGRWASVEVSAAGKLDALDGTVRVSSEHLELDSVVTHDDTGLLLAPESSLRVLLTPEAYASLAPDSGLTLDGPVEVVMEHPRLAVPVTGGRLEAGRMALRAPVISGDWLLTDDEGQKITLAAPRLGVVAEELRRELVVVLESVVTVEETPAARAAAARRPAREAASAEEPVEEPRPMVARLGLGGLMTDGRTTSLRVENAPTALVDRLAGAGGGLTAAFGPVVQLARVRVDSDAGGPRRAEVSMNWDPEAGAPAEGAFAVLPPAAFEIDDAGWLTVADGKDIELRVRVTEALGDHWLGRLHPVLFDAQSADRPVRVVLDGETFRYPLRDKSMAGANVDAQVDLGTLRFGAASLFATIVDWTGHSGEQAVFEPAMVTLRGGELRYDRLALSVGNVQLEFRGAVDLVEQVLAEMSIRVPASSIVKVFQDLEDVIEPDDALVIPMRGPIRDPEVDVEAFRRDMLRLVLAQQRQEAERELGGLFDRVREAVGEELGGAGGDVVDDVLRRLLGGG